MRLRSAIYEGTVRHRRRAPVEHSFRYPHCMMYLDLDELDVVFHGTSLWKVGEPAPVSWRREDYLGDSETPLAEAVRARVERATGRRPAGPIRMLTHLRHFGLCFNPVTFYYCFRTDGETLEAIVAEITNTPWRERHAYVLEADGLSAGRPAARFRFAKAFHVSPFMPMDLEYDWLFSAPSDALFVQMTLRPGSGGARQFDATLHLRRREISPAALRAVLVRHPFLTAGVIARIHWHALRLWVKKVPVRSHPGTRPLETPGIQRL